VAGFDSKVDESVLESWKNPRHCRV